MDPRVIDLYNDYVHGSMPRRDFLARLAGIAGGAAAATAMLALIEPRYAQAQQVAPDDPALKSSYVAYPGTQGEVRAYLAEPASAPGALPGVLVIHENRGLNAHIEDVARRLALAGYRALAPDGLSVAGGAPTDQEQARDLFGRTDRAVIDADILAGVPHLAAREGGNGRVGAIGFCYGGGMALRCAAEHAQLGAAICFYGAGLDADQTARVKAPLQMHYAGEDARVNAGIDAFRALLDQHHVAYSLNMYPGTQHGFHNDSTAARYDKTASALAWQRSLAFFDRYLKATA
jgi:carboxymethylenebutenolidase